ncbi:type I restriction-modification system, specificity subunit S [Lacticaseibacillus casei 12A]|uniref:restriction endonuclease subunit S n=1 Tax=Lacticaseibacillus paracasei TaxID=1597 RepID=UPI0002981BD7|nr:restriction endonuclease subunit S [Lacticaseibacillus paracasei]EKP97628.1 type I restriction-modification system, specificity subunit S [Lacticaseibacillus casei 12A]
MSKDAKNVPALRFKGYSDAWEKRKFKNLVVRVNKTSDNSTIPSVEFEDIISKQGRLNKDVRLKVNSKQGIYFEPQDVLFGKLRPYLQNWLFPSFYGRAVGDFWVLRANSSLLSEYLFVLIQSPRFQSVANISSGTKMPRSDWNTVSNTSFSIPVQSEQRRIEQLFNVLDDLIAATQDKKKNLKYLRESIVLRLLDQDFNLINDSVPWKESRLGELVTFRKGRGYSKNELTFSGTPIILYGRLYTNYQVVIDNITDTFVKEHSDSVKSSGGDVIIPSSGETATDIARASSITRPDIILGGDLIVLNFNTNLINSPFLALSLSSGKRKSYLSRHAQGKSVVHLQNESLASLSLKLPSPDTQARIAEIILQIDKIIVQYDEKVTLLQRLKKMLLQGLFI